MKTRADFPFVYFLPEQNTVLVYRIENDEYIKGEDLIESGHGQVYHVDSPEEFESFNHLDRKQAEGISIFLNHQGMDEMARVINEEIQKVRGDSNGKKN